MSNQEIENGLDVRMWGPEAWNFMHATTFMYPEKDPSEIDKKNIKEFFDSVGKVLPCMRCRYHFNKMLEKYPVPTKNRDALTRWLVDRHNDVNKRLDKPTMAYEHVKKKYDRMQNVCPISLQDSNGDCCSSLSLETQRKQKTQNHIISSIVITLLVLFVLLGILVGIYYIAPKISSKKSPEK